MKVEQYIQMVMVSSPIVRPGQCWIIGLAWRLKLVCWIDRSCSRVIEDCKIQFDLMKIKWWSLFYTLVVMDICFMIFTIYRKSVIVSLLILLFLSIFVKLVNLLHLYEEFTYIRLMYKDALCCPLFFNQWKIYFLMHSIP